MSLIIDRARVISIVYSIKGISGFYLNVQVNVSLCLATPCDTYTLSFLLNVCTCLGVAGRQSIDYATSPTTLYSVLFYSLFIIMYVVENKSLSHYHRSNFCTNVSRSANPTTGVVTAVTPSIPTGSPPTSVSHDSGHPHQRGFPTHYICPQCP